MRDLRLGDWLRRGLTAIPFPEDAVARGETRERMGIGRHNTVAFLGKAELTPRERYRLVRWWIEASGLTPTELREIATGVWADRVFDTEQRLKRTQAA